MSHGAEMEFVYTATKGHCVIAGCDHDHILRMRLQLLLLLLYIFAGCILFMVEIKKKNGGG